MMERKWTPGPWMEIGDGYREDGIEITTSDRQANDMVEIAAVEVDFEEEFDAEQRANARLIAAAPDLYEACAGLLAWADKALAPGDAGCDFMNGDSPANKDGQNGWDELETAIAGVRAALAKAEGRDDG